MDKGYYANGNAQIDDLKQVAISTIEMNKGYYANGNAQIDNLKQVAIHNRNE